MTKRSIRFGCFALASLFCATGAMAAPPQYTARKTAGPMVMDGVLDEPAWEKAEPVGPFKFPWFKEGDQEQTEAKIVWDNERIYFAFRCEDKHIRADHYVHNSAVCRDDCCEAFISPVPEGDQRLDYINYEINCIGTWKVGYHAKSRGKNLGSWEDVSGIEIGRTIDGTCNNDDDTDQGWTLEFSIPFSHFDEFAATFPPKEGQVIFLGLHRCGGKTNQQFSQWAPSQTDRPQFHSPEDFGKITFSTDVLE